MYETIEVEVKDRVAWLTLNRPKKLNAIDLQMMMELRRAFTDLDGRDDVGVVILRGHGRAFCAGADLGWSEVMTPKDRVEQGRLGQKTFGMMDEMGKPVVAAVHGYVLGGGLELALGADFIVAADDVQLGLPEITLSAQPPYRPKMTEDGDPDQPEVGGAAPNWGSLVRLPQRIGKALTKELVFTGVRVDGARALRLGLVNEVHPKAEFDEKVAELAKRLAAMNSYNLRLIKELVNRGWDWIEPHTR